jgi:pimeloyl-ACP methyl ester carboxylesterase
VRGAQSDYILEKDYEYMKHHFPNYEMVTLEDAGHWIHVDDPEGFNKATEEFFCNK